MYPNNETANLNAAVISLGKNDLVAARRYLNKAGSSPEAQNARAVLAIRENRLGEAEQLLREIDLPQARHNLDELQQYLQSIE
jgi:Flp pilus assembly protein TadD